MQNISKNVEFFNKLFFNEKNEEDSTIIYYYKNYFK